MEFGLDALADTQPREMISSVLADEIAALDQLSTRLSAQITRRLAVFQSREEAAAEGMLSTESWLTHRLQMSCAHASQQVAVAAAYAAGEAADVLDPAQLRRVLTYLRHIVDPNGAEADADAAHERRGLWCSPTPDGMVVVDGLLDPDSGATDSRGAPRRSP